MTKNISKYLCVASKACLQQSHLPAVQVGVNKQFVSHQRLFLVKLWYLSLVGYKTTTCSLCFFYSSWFLLCFPSELRGGNCEHMIRSTPNSDLCHTDTCLHWPNMREQSGPGTRLSLLALQPYLQSSPTALIDSSHLINSTAVQGLRPMSCSHIRSHLHCCGVIRCPSGKQLYYRGRKTQPTTLLPWRYFQKHGEKM